MRSCSVRKALVTGIQSLRVDRPGVTVPRWSLKRRAKFLFLGAVISNVSWENPLSSHSAPADRCEATAASPPQRQAAISAWCQLSTVPATR